MKILKFGGSSVKNANAMRNVAEIISDYNEKILVVLSACGGITNKITESINVAANDKNYKKYIDEINSHHLNIIDELITNNELHTKAKNRINELIKSLSEIHEGVNLLNECTPKSIDQATSFGELLSTSVFYFYLKNKGLNASIINSSEIITTDSQFNSASVIFDKFYSNVNEKLLPEINDNNIIIAQGFIASDEQGRTTTLGRGGSDYSASLYGAGLKKSGIAVEEIQIWTDVSGVLSGDPRKLLNTKTVPVMTFSEIRELSFYGAKVLHPDTIKPANEAQIPVKVLNTFVPLNPGTIITDTPPDKSYSLHSAVLKENCILYRKKVSVKENSHYILSGYLKKILDDNIKVMFSNSTESSISIITEDVKISLDDNELTSEKVSIIALSGTNITTDTKGQILLDIASVLSDNMPLQIVYGSSDVSILMTYKKGSGKKALKAIHELIINKYL
jgi:aspartate kinase